MKRRRVHLEHIPKPRVYGLHGVNAPISPRIATMAFTDPLDVINRELFGGSADLQRLEQCLVREFGADVLIQRMHQRLCTAMNAGVDLIVITNVTTLEQANFIRDIGGVLVHVLKGEGPAQVPVDVIHTL